MRFWGAGWNRNLWPSAEAKFGSREPARFCRALGRKLGIVPLPRGRGSPEELPQSRGKAPFIICFCFSYERRSSLG
jgi:hypothetical protein